MAVFMVDTYIAIPEKLGEFTLALKKYEKWIKEHPELFKEMKSRKVFSHMLGGNWGGYVEMWEFENLADFEKCFNKIVESDYMTTIYPELNALIIPGTDSLSIWNSVP